MAHNVSESIVSAELCIGCGVCAAACPTGALGVEFNPFGELVARQSGTGICRDCGKCLAVCPFSPRVENKDELARQQFGGDAGNYWQPETGFYHATFVGHVNSELQRMSRSSGGLATWLLKNLLLHNAVDRVVSVGCGGQSLFEYRVMRTVREVDASARSSYYPVTMAEVLKEVRRGEGKAAIVGLPCFIKGVRLAMKQDPQLADRIRVLVGLVCGGTRSRFYAEYLCALSGGNPAAMSSVDFRVKDPLKAADEFEFHYSCRATQSLVGPVRPVRPVRLRVDAETRGRLWSSRYFEPNPCRFCDDVFAETADIAFMDAWLDPYRQDPGGTNLVLSRRTVLTDALRKGRDRGELLLQEIPIEDVILSQRAVLARKRSSQFAVRSPQLITPLRRIELGLERLVITSSRRAFAAVRSRSENPATIVRHFQRAMNLPVLALKVVKRIAAMRSSNTRARRHKKGLAVRNSQSLGPARL
jgi:coenzyme F420-reducing hydrogenase beta subunit